MKITLLTFFIICLFSSISEWKTYTAKDGSFRIKFPGQPKEMNMNSGFGVDQTLILQYFSFDTTNHDEGAAFLLTIMSLSDEILKPEFNDTQRFEVLRKYSLTTIQMIGEVLETDNISISGYPGIFIKGEIRQAVNKEPYPPIFVKSYLVENKLYILKVTASLKFAKNKIHETFFDSFELLE